MAVSFLDIIRSITFYVYLMNINIPSIVWKYCRQSPTIGIKKYKGSKTYSSFKFLSLFDYNGSNETKPKQQMQELASAVITKTKI